MAIWFTATIRPRMRAGVISAMYIGVEIEAMPMPTPPRNRKTMNVPMSCGSAVPMAEARNMRAARNMASLRPNRSEMRPDEQHAGRAADQHAARGPALHEIAQAEPGRQRLDRAGDDAGVVAEEQPAQRGDQADGGEVKRAAFVCGSEAVVHAV